MTNPIVVVDYDPQWPVAFATIRSTLESTLAGVPDRFAFEAPPDAIRQNTYVTVAELDEIETGNRV